MVGRAHERPLLRVHQGRCCRAADWYRLAMNASVRNEGASCRADLVNGPCAAPTMLNVLLHAYAAARHLALGAAKAPFCVPRSRVNTQLPYV